MSLRHEDTDRQRQSQKESDRHRKTETQRQTHRQTKTLCFRSKVTQASHLLSPREGSSRTMKIRKV